MSNSSFITWGCTLGNPLWYRRNPQWTFPIFDYWVQAMPEPCWSQNHGNVYLFQNTTSSYCYKQISAYEHRICKRGTRFWYWNFLVSICSLSSIDRSWLSRDGIWNVGSDFYRNMLWLHAGKQPVWGAKDVERIDQNVFWTSKTYKK